METIFKFFLFFSILSLFSCSRDEITDTSIDSKSTNKEDVSLSNSITLLKNKLEDINQNYPNLNDRDKRNNSNYTEQWSLKKWCRVGAADVAGAWVGSRFGGMIGVWAGGPAGATTGAIIGGVIVGAAASYGASYAVPINDYFPYIDSYPDMALEFEDPNDNPFDYVGEKHNSILKDLLLSDKNLDRDNSNRFDSFYDINLTQDEIQFLNKNTSIVHKSYDESLEIFNSKDQVYSIISENFTDQEKLSLVMNNYFDVIFKNEDNYQNVMYITYDYEKLVINSNELDNSEKNILLEGLSVAKYSFTFWHNVL